MPNAVLTEVSCSHGSLLESVMAQGSTQARAQPIPGDFTLMVGLMLVNWAEAAGCAGLLHLLRLAGSVTSQRLPPATCVEPLVCGLSKGAEHWPEFFPFLQKGKTGQAKHSDF